MRDQVRATMPEAQFFTLTGPGLRDEGRFDYLWVSSDPQVASKTEGKEFSGNYGEVRLQDQIAAQVDGLASEVNRAARSRVTGLVEETDRLLKEVAQAADDRARTRLLQDILDLGARIDTELQDIRGKARSYPSLDPQRPPQNLASTYLFYLPVVFRQPGQDVYFRGAVRLAVSTESIRAQLTGSQRRLIVQTGIIALVVLGLGLIGALIMASITVGPIKKLAAGVAVIRDTENKQDLKDFKIDVGSRDEIGGLADAFNDLTQVWVKADSAQKEMMVGKDIQRMFLPLTKDVAGRSGSTGTWIARPQGAGE